MKRLLISTALSAVPFLFATGAQADCDLVSGFGADTDVTCDATSVLDGPDAIETRGINPRPFDAVEGEYLNAPDGISVLVEKGATIDTRTTVDLEGDLARAIDLTGSDDSDLTNEGTILSGDEGIQADDDFEVTNFGLIEAVEKAFDVDKDLDLVNEAGAVIRSTTNEGIEAGDRALIDNFGTIQAFDDAVQFAEDANIYNNGLIENTQVIGESDDPQDAIDIDWGFIENDVDGVIRSLVDAAIDYDFSEEESTIINRGTITGAIAVNTQKLLLDDAGDVDEPADLGMQVIENYGLLEGTSGLALDLGLGDDELMMFEGGTVVGAADFGGGEDILAFDLDFVFDQDFAQGEIFNGGLDEDVVLFDNLAFEDVEVANLDGERASLVIGGTYALELNSWELFLFGGDDTAYSVGDLNTIAAVPLPTGAVLLGTGLLAFGAASRRRKQV